MARPKNDEPKDPGDAAKDAADGPGQIGDAIVGGLKTLGEAGDKVKNIPASAIREGKNAVKKGRKLLGLKKGGVLPKYGTGSSTQLLTAGFDTAFPKQSTATLASDIVGQTPPVPDTTTLVPSPALDAVTNTVATSSGLVPATGNMVPIGSGPKPQGIRTLGGYKDGGTPGKETSGSLIHKGLHGAALGGFITQKGLRTGAKGVAGKRMPKKGVMA